MTNPKSAQSTASSLFPKDARAYFDQSQVTRHIAPRYVAWIDLMGARGIMGRSLAKASNFIGKIHDAVLSQSGTLKLGSGHILTAYPVIDGAYISASHRADLDDCLSEIMKRLAGSFVHEVSHEHRFLVRGGIALGNVLEGQYLSKGSEALSNSEGYAGSVALGSAIGQAYLAEGQAPPFGFCVDVTARSVSMGSQPTYPTRFWRWWADDGADGAKQAAELAGKLEEYFEWMSHRLMEHEYPKDSFERHRALMQEYFRA